ncbi:CAAX amino terminal protease self- immunity [bacterium BMS3Abin03]|nr:CAAX amino terminal protease self- immunity [bacterium BMS3Abin03]
MSDFENNSEEHKPDKDGQNPLKPFRHYKDQYPLISPVTAALLGLIGCFFLYQIVGGLLTLAIFGMELEKANVNSLRLMTMAGEILFILLPALLFARWIYGDVSEVVYTKIPSWFEVLIFSSGIIILIPLLQSYLYIQNYFIEQWAANSGLINSIKSLFDSLNELVEKTYGNLLKANSIPEVLLVILVIAIVPAIAEEIMFRGYIQRSFQKKIKPFWAALITAVFFGLYHFSPYGLLPLIGLGFYFGFASYTSKTILIPVFLHFLNNFGAVLLYFIVGDDEIISSKVSDAGSLFSNIFLFIILSMLFAIIIFVIHKYYSKTRLS